VGSGPAGGGQASAAFPEGIAAADLQIGPEPAAALREIEAESAAYFCEARRRDERGPGGIAVVREAAVVPLFEQHLDAERVGEPLHLPPGAGH